MGDAVLITLQAEGATAYRDTGQVMGCREKLHSIMLDLLLVYLEERM